MRDRLWGVTGLFGFCLRPDPEFRTDCQRFFREADKIGIGEKVKKGGIMIYEKKVQALSGKEQRAHLKDL